MLRVVSPLALVATLVIVAAGCGGDGASAPAADTTTTAAVTPTHVALFATVAPPVECLSAETWCRGRLWRTREDEPRP